MSDFAEFRTVLDAMLAERFGWYRDLAHPVQTELLDAVTALAQATRSTIREHATQAQREAERAKRLELLVLPCFACGRQAQRIGGRWFDERAVYAAWARHHGIHPDMDGNSDIAGVQLALSETAHGDDGAHAMCALVASVRDELLTEEYPAHVVQVGGCR